MPKTITTIVAAALAVIAPFVVWTNAGGHDSEVHFQMWTEVERQWKEGISYPRWAPLANYKYGEATFMFYPPMSWTLGSALLFIFPLKMVPGAHVFIALFIAGGCMFKLAREWLTPADARLAAALYTINPYNLVIVFWRGDFAELLAAALLPAVILGAVRAGEGGMANVGLLGFALALTWLANIPGAVIATYTAALVILIMGLHERKWRPTISRTAGLAFAFALAAFFIVPAAYERQWVNISEVLRPWLTPANNLLFTAADDPSQRIFNLFVSGVACMKLVALAVALLFRDQLSSRSTAIRKMALITAGSATLLLFPLSKPVWRSAPELQYVQFPWRLLSVISVNLALLISATRVPQRSKWVAGLALSAPLWLISSPLFHTWNGSELLFRVHSSLTEEIGYEGLPEYASRGSDISKLERSSLPALVVNESRGLPASAANSSDISVRVSKWGTEAKVLRVNSIRGCKLALRLLAYPAWKIEVNGRAAIAQVGAMGEIVLQVPAGYNEVRITFSRTLDRVLGSLLSGTALAVFAVLHMRERYLKAMRCSLRDASRVQSAVTAE